MPWPCFLIEESSRWVDWFVYHRDQDELHRTVIAAAECDFYTCDEDPPGGWPDGCPVCGKEAHRSRVGYGRYTNPTTGEEKRNVWDFGPGAMFDGSEWTPARWRGPDGICLSVVLPPGGQNDVWHIDGPARDTNHCPWTRTGVPPLVTVTPSIATPRYHSHLTNGVLLD